MANYTNEELAEVYTAFRQTLNQNGFEDWARQADEAFKSIEPIEMFFRHYIWSFIGFTYAFRDQNLEAELLEKLDEKDRPENPAIRIRLPLVQGTLSEARTVNLKDVMPDYRDLHKELVLIADQLGLKPPPKPDSDPEPDPDDSFNPDDNPTPDAGSRGPRRGR